jgi:hypothetical protein
MLGSAIHSDLGNHYDFCFPKSTTRVIPMTWHQESDDGPPMVLTGMVFSLPVYRDKAEALAAATPLFTLTVGAGLLIAPADGRIEVLFTLAQLDSLPGGGGYYRLRYQDSLGNSDLLMEGGVFVT